MEDLLPEASDLTVARLLDVDEIRRGDPEVISGADRLDRTVRWVHIADSENVDQFLEGGELVLSTGLSFRSSAKSTAIFLDQLESASAAGAIIELIDDAGRADDAAVRTVRAAARSRDMPIIVLRRRIKFVRVTQIAHQELLNRQLARVEHARTVHEVFTQLSLESAGPQEIVHRTAQLLDSLVILEDVSHRVLARSRGNLSSTHSRTGAAGKGHLGEGERRLQTPVGLRDRRWGRLLAPEHLASDEEAAQVIERAAQALTLARMAERDEQDLLVQAQGGLIREILESSELGEEQAREQASALGFAPRSSMIPVVVRVDRNASTDPATLQLRERSLHRSFLSAADELHCSTLSASLQSGSFGVVVAPPASADEDTILARLLADMSAQDITVGIGRSSGSIVDAAVNLDSAVQVAEIASTLEVRQQLYYRFSDVRLRGLISSLSDDPRVRAFAEAELAPLLDAASGQDGEDMIALLEKFLRHGGNKSALARSGFLSRPALYARLDKLQQRLGVSLDDAESRTALHVAVLWLRMNR